MVLTAPVAGPVTSPGPALTTAEFSAFAGTDDSSSLEPYVVGALNMIQRRTGPIIPGQWRYPARQLGSNGGLRLSWPRYPRLQVTSLDKVTDPSAVDITALLLPTMVDWDTGGIMVPYAAAGYWTITVTLSRPFEDIEALQLAANIVAKNLWEVQNGMRARPTPFDGQAPVPMWSGMSSRAKEIIAGYTRKPTG